MNAASGYGTDCVLTVSRGATLERYAHGTACVLTDNSEASSWLEAFTVNVVFRHPSPLYQRSVLFV
ncbi:protein of unknown function [Shewanella benthica]|uniref:Uncharacterized protein n=1 Tax=Shewanella benthica TaxID=43661 RepID=A0A330M930_9GAMM|nr:protein of unknown function [Shewanella benthica]